MHDDCEIVKHFLVLHSMLELLLYDQEGAPPDCKYRYFLTEWIFIDFLFEHSSIQQLVVSGSLKQ